MLVREVLKIREGDYVGISTSEVIKKKQRKGRVGEESESKVVISSKIYR